MNAIDPSGTPYRPKASTGKPKKLDMLDVRRSLEIIQKQIDQIQKDMPLLAPGDLKSRAKLEQKLEVAKQELTKVAADHWVDLNAGWQFIGDVSWFTGRTAAWALGMKSPSTEADPAYSLGNKVADKWEPIKPDKPLTPDEQKKFDENNKKLALKFQREFEQYLKDEQEQIKKNEAESKAFLRIVQSHIELIEKNPKLLKPNSTLIPGKNRSVNSEAEVRLLQLQLYALSQHPDFRLDTSLMQYEGLYNDQVMSLVMEFQKIADLKADGYYGPETRKRMKEELAKILPKTNLVENSSKETKPAQ